MTTKQRAYLKSLAMTMDPIFQIGKNSMTPEFTAAVAEALERGNCGSAGSKRADQNQRAEELCGRSAGTCRTGSGTYQISGGTGNWEKDCSL